MQRFRQFFTHVILIHARWLAKVLVNDSSQKGAVFALSKTAEIAASAAGTRCFVPQHLMERGKVGDWSKRGWDRWLWGEEGGVGGYAVGLG